MLRVVTKSSFHTLSCDKPLSIEMYLNSIYSYLKMFILLLRKIDKNFMYNKKHSENADTSTSVTFYLEL